MERSWNNPEPPMKPHRMPMKFPAAPRLWNPWNAHETPGMLLKPSKTPWNGHETPWDPLKASWNLLDTVWMPLKLLETLWNTHVTLLGHSQITLECPWNSLNTPATDLNPTEISRNSPENFWDPLEQLWNTLETSKPPWNAPETLWTSRNPLKRP